MHATALLVVGLIAAHVYMADGHGLMYKPLSRNYRSYMQGGFGYNGLADGLSGGGKYKVQAATGGAWTSIGSRPGSMCGDAPGSNRWMKPSTISAKWKAGQVVMTETMIWNWHEGRVSFWVCKKGTTRLNKHTCKQLTRADGVSKYFYPPNNVGWTTSESVPAYTDKSFTWRRTPSSGTSYDQYRGTPLFQVKYRLPRKFKCKGCIFVWHYLTGNSCAPPCDRADPHYKNGKCQHGTAQCGSPGASWPEEFWNCADVNIV